MPGADTSLDEQRVEHVQKTIRCPSHPGIPSSSRIPRARKRRRRHTATQPDAPHTVLVVRVVDRARQGRGTSAGYGKAYALDTLPYNREADTASEPLGAALPEPPPCIRLVVVWRLPALHTVAHFFIARVIHARHGNLTSGKTYGRKYETEYVLAIRHRRYLDPKWLRMFA